MAQGAFSVYDTTALRAAGGWPDCIGEDIVMTWALLDARRAHDLRAHARSPSPKRPRRFTTWRASAAAGRAG